MHKYGDNTIITELNPGAIVLQPTGNYQSIWRFMRPVSGREIVCHKWTTLPMPNEVIDRVYALAYCPSAHR